MNISRKRFLKELNTLIQSNDPTIVVHGEPNIDNLLIDIYIKNHEKYNGDIPFTISYKVSSEYPFTPPIVTFVGTIPIHPHIYRNGHICLDILYDPSWSPAQSLQSICLSLQSMLQSNTIMERPEGDARYCKTAPSDPRKSKWLYHDDNV